MLLSLLALAALTAQPSDAQTAKLDRARGIRLLSGADATSLWRGYKQPSFPSKGWTADGTTLRTGAGGGGGDIITTDQFGDFEFTFEFSTPPKANSGVIFRCTEAHDTMWQTGPEYQVLEDVGYGAQPTDMHAAGALYDLYAPREGKKLMPANEWNQGRIYLRNGVIQHWLNGVKIVEARMFNEDGTPAAEWLEKIKGSKFNAYEGFGVQAKGHIGLQDHGDAVAYRNLRVRDLGAPTPGQVNLLTTASAAHGRDIAGWTCIVPELADKHEHPGAPWSVKDGVLSCSGHPAGYIRTEKTYTNFILRLQWRFPGQPGNSGVLVRQIGTDKVWPRSVEAQLHSGNAGDFWNIDDFTMTTDPARTNGRNTRKTHGAERPVGEWNEYEIIVNRGDVILLANGEELNRATGVEEVAGHICLQSEGAPIQFRNIVLTPLD